jgi:ADP-ribose pyrophosphatase
MALFQSNQPRRDALFFILGGLLSFFLSLSYFYSIASNDGLVSGVPRESTLRTKTFSMEGDTSIVVPFDPFPEAPWRTPNTISARTVTSTPFARFEIHKVKTESGAIVNDWLWTDERAHVNILVHLKAENKYLLFRQRKYGLTKEYYAAIGGLFDIGDTPEGCARRELLEETGLDAEELVNLGAYRVQVNRGGGILHAFYAKNCVKSDKYKKSDDYEKQSKVLLSKDELVDVALSGEIGEAQWLATIALGLLHEEHHK